MTDQTDLPDSVQPADASPPRTAGVKPPAPQHLRPAGARLWLAITTDYDLRPDEYRVLEDACHEADLVDELDDQRREMSVLITGSMGQQVLNPLISEVRQHRSTLAVLLAKLKLPDDLGQPSDGGEQSSEESTPGDRSAKARKAAQTRWARRAPA